MFPLETDAKTRNESACIAAGAHHLDAVLVADLLERARDLLDPEKWKPVFRKDHAQTKR
jgi:hypothetical protein